MYVFSINFVRTSFFRPDKMAPVLAALQGTAAILAASVKQKEKDQ